MCTRTSETGRFILNWRRALLSDLFAYMGKLSGLTTGLPMYSKRLLSKARCQFRMNHPVAHLLVHAFVQTAVLPKLNLILDRGNWRSRVHDMWAPLRCSSTLVRSIPWAIQEAPMQEHTPRRGFILKVIEHSNIGPRQESVPKCSMTHRELLKWHCLFAWFACLRTGF